MPTLSLYAEGNTDEQEESDLFIVAMKTGEQTRATGGGAGGAKEEDRGEHRRATHAPDSEPGKVCPERLEPPYAELVGFAVKYPGGGPVRESRTPGYPAGVLSNEHPYRDKVSNRKGIANQTGPESCVAHREVRDEALGARRSVDRGACRPWKPRKR